MGVTSPIPAQAGLLPKVVQSLILSVLQSPGSCSLAGALVQHFNPLHCEKWFPPIQLLCRPCLSHQHPSLDGCCYCGILARSPVVQGLRNCRTSVVFCIFWGIMPPGRKQLLIQNCPSPLSQHFSLSFLSRCCPSIPVLTGRS